MEKKYRVVTTSGKYKGSYKNEFGETKYFNKRTAEVVAKQLSRNKRIGKTIVIPMKSKKKLGSRNSFYGLPF